MFKGVSPINQEFNMEITAMPYRIGDGFKPDFIKQGKADEFVEYAKKISREVHSIQGVPIFAFKDGRYLYFWSVYEGGLAYFMKTKKVQPRASTGVTLPSVSLKRSSYQAEVWRDASLLMDYPSFVTDVFYKYLLSSTRNVMSDAQQSDSGERFWARRVREALLSSKHRVWILDAEESGSSLIINAVKELTDRKQLPLLYSEGEDYSGMYKRLLITQD